MNNFQLKPSGIFLMDFFYVNLSIYDKQVELISDKNILDRIKLYLIRKKFISLIDKVWKLIYNENCLEFNLLFNGLKRKNDNNWDYLLYTIIIKEMSSLAANNFEISIEFKLNLIMTSYLHEVLNNMKLNAEIFGLKIEKIKIYAEMELLSSSANLNNKTGQFTNRK